jgi:uncharacterized protein (TIGR04562 family)
VLFNLETLRAMVGGRSAIDVARLQVADLAEAERFLDCYGYQWSDPEERAEIEDIRSASLAFLANVLLDDGEVVAREVADEVDVRKLLLVVSGTAPAPREQRRWACALLRVMHTVAHARSDLAEHYAEPIEAQILGRFREHLREADGGLMLGDIPLVHYETRARKPLESVVLKLLHKPENVAADIFDRIGVRFVTRSRMDALKVVRFLRRNNVVMFANTKPSRSKNTLVDLDELERAMRVTVDPDTLAAAMQRWPYPERDAGGENPHSRDYHAIQFTARQRVRVRDGNGQIFRFFFPFEVQVLDEASFVESRAGFSSHDEYKSRQRSAARRRVLGPLADSSTPAA